MDFLGFDFGDIVSFSYIMFFYVLPALLALLVIVWVRDWIVKLGTKWKKAAIKKYDEMRSDRWFVILEAMKIFMFLILLFPLLAVVNYATNERASDPAPEIYTSTMPFVFIAVTMWYLLAIVIYGIYQKNKEDKEREQERRLLQGSDD